MYSTHSILRNGLFLAFMLVFVIGWVLVLYSRRFVHQGAAAFGWDQLLTLALLAFLIWKQPEARALVKILFKSPTYVLSGRMPESETLVMRGIVLFFSLGLAADFVSDAIGAVHSSIGGLANNYPLRLLHSLVFPAIVAGAAVRWTKKVRVAKGEPDALA